MIRVGTVSDYNAERDAAKVYFEEDEIVSDWLPIVRQSEWMPEIGQTVLCLFEDGFTPLGYIIGGLK